MDKEKVIKKIKQGAPAASAIVVAACIGMSLSGYQAPVYEAQAQTKETKTTDAEEEKKTESKAKGSTVPAIKRLSCFSFFFCSASEKFFSSSSS